MFSRNLTDSHDGRRVNCPLARALLCLGAQELLVGGVAVRVCGDGPGVCFRSLQVGDLS